MSATAEDNRLFPLFADLRGRRVLVVGGGEVALRKTHALLEAGALLRVVALDLQDGFKLLPEAVELRQEAWREEFLDGAWLAVAATDDDTVNAAVAAAADARRILCNVVDRSELCSFQVPALVRRGPLLVAISSAGTAPILARQLRARIELLLDDSLGRLASMLGRWRGRIRAALPDLPGRRAFLETLESCEVGRLLRQGRETEAEQQLASELATRTSSSAPRRGRVSLVGAGPGDAGLLTLKGHRRLHEADVILHDQLVSPEVLALARRDAELVAVGKQAGGHRVEQYRINALMVEHAAAGRRVVRLKGGDGFIFGRGGEELEHLRAAGIDYEVVPGITAALACAAYAGVPLTHRDHARSLQLVTAHCRDSLDALDYRALARQQQTLAVYMGVAGLSRLRRQLIRHGRPADTPFVLVENGSRTDQRVVAGRLDEVDTLAALHQVRSPALLILGEVAALAPTLHWYGAPLLGRVQRQAAA